MQYYRRPEIVRLEDYSHQVDYVLNPKSNQPIEKYGHTWYYLIRNGYHENLLEALPIVDLEMIISPKTSQPIEKYGKAYNDLIQQGYNEYKLNRFTIQKSEHKITKVNQLDLKTNKPQRGGVILYTIVNDQLLFGFGLDSTYNEFTDFSGGISYKKENCIEGALREFCEETEGLYCALHTEDVIDAPVMVDKHNLIIFLYTDESPDEITYSFQHLKRAKKSEVKNIIWVTEQELKSAIQLKLPYIYSRLRNFLAKFGNFYNQLK